MDKIIERIGPFNFAQQFRIIHVDAGAFVAGGTKCLDKPPLLIHPLHEPEEHEAGEPAFDEVGRGESTQGFTVGHDARHPHFRNGAAQFNHGQMCRFDGLDKSGLATKQLADDAVRAEALQFCLAVEQIAVKQPAVLARIAVDALDVAGFAPSQRKIHSGVPVCHGDIVAKRRRGRNKKRNSIFEYRNSKQTEKVSKTKEKFGKQSVLNFEPSDFEFVSDFDIRISDLFTTATEGTEFGGKKDRSGVPQKHRGGRRLQGDTTKQHGLPQHRNVVASEGFVMADHGQRLTLCLCDEQSVKRIAMMERQAADCQRVAGRDIQQ